MTEIVCADVLDWAREYKGPKFHALLCDPSYAMSQKKPIDKAALAELPENPTVADVIAAYHSIQQWGDTGFMSKKWDDAVAFNPETWAALAEHLYPGAFGMAFASARGWHRLAVAIEDAGLRIFPSIFCWATGQSFPKATNIHVQKLKHAFQSSVQGDLRSMEKAQDFQDDYLEHCHSCDAPLHWLEVAFQDGVPSPGDSQEHSHYAGPSVQIQVDNERISVRLGRLFFRRAKLDYSHLALRLHELGASLASTEQKLQPSSSAETLVAATSVSSDGPSRMTESKTDAQHEYGPQRAETIGHTEDRQIGGDVSLSPETHYDKEQSKSDSPLPASRFHGETASGKCHTQIDGQASRCIPSLTLSPTLEPPQDLVYTHYTKGCIECQIRDFEEARRFEGHRYGGQLLKNAIEPIIVFQKPYEGKPVECITETGAGSLWIDGGRIGTPEDTRRVKGGWQDNGYVGGEYDAEKYNAFEARPHQGRWPANFVLVHHPECRRVGERRVRGTGERPSTGDHRGMFSSKYQRANAYRPAYNKDDAEPIHSGYTDPDGLETIAAWECHEDCPARRLGEQSGEAGSTLQRNYGNQAGGWPNTDKEIRKVVTTHNDTGTAARFFFQAAWNLERADPVRYQAKAARRERDLGLEHFVTLELEVCLCDENTERVTSLERAISEWVTVTETQSCNTDSSGNRRTVLFHEIILSTTSTETNKTTVSQTWNVSTSQPTNAFIADVIRTVRDSGSNLVASAENISQSLITMSEQVASAHGARLVVSKTPLRISAGAERKRNGHPTIKPLSLAQWLATLLLPPEEYAPRRLLVPFAGSGSEGVGAGLAGWDEMMLIEMDPDTCEIAEARLAHWLNEPRQLELHGA